MTEALAAGPDDDADLRRLADAGFGLTHLRDGQLAGMRALAAGRDVLAVMPTGYGKSAIYQVPALLLHGRQQRPAVVVSPLISLQEDQLDGLRDAAGPGGAVAVNSSHSAAEQERAWQAVESGEAAFLFLAPEQLAKNSTVERIAALNIALFVVDEAHCVSSWHRCRRQFLLGYFGEDLPEPCGNCDTCTDGPALLQEHGVEHDGGAGAAVLPTAARRRGRVPAELPRGACPLGPGTGDGARRRPPHRAVRPRGLPDAVAQGRPGPRPADA